ncbi:MAG: superoxide dismutase [Candidatus Staskawiczbacteria bacterium]|jgi:Fe-Mn family superoxide dismutase
MENKLYTLLQLPYGYKDLEPYISEEQLRIHHQKHHQAYVNGANAIFERLEKSRKEDSELDFKATLKELSFHTGGYTLHNLFWTNLAPTKSEPEGELKKLIDESFGSIERFKKEFSQTALSVEGSGWAVLTFDPERRKLLMMQIEKHNVNVFPSYSLLLVLDVWEHAYYLDYKNDRAKFIEGFWNIVDWKEVGARLGRAS